MLTAVLQEAHTGLSTVLSNGSAAHLESTSVESISGPVLRLHLSESAILTRGDDDFSTDAISGTVEGVEEGDGEAGEGEERAEEDGEGGAEKAMDEEQFDPLDEVNPRNLPEPRKRNHFQCKECDKVCRNAWLLEKHVKAKHKQQDCSDTSKICPYCKRVFLTSNSRAGHMEMCHMKPRVNGDCGCPGACSGHNDAATSSAAPSTATPSTATPSTTTPTTTTPTTSSSTQSTGARSRLRSTNTKTTSEEPVLNVSTRHTCTMCKKSYISINNLEKHIRNTHAKPASITLPLPAPESASQPAPNASLPLPSSERGFACDQCGWRGKTKNVLTRHMNGTHKK